MAIDLSTAILDDRARLIARETAITARADAVTSRIIDRWATELRAATRTGKPITSAARRTAIAARLGRIAETEIKAYESATGETLREVYKSAVYRQSYLLQNQIVEFDSPTAAGFADYNPSAVARAIGGRIPGLSNTVTFAGIGKRAEGRLRQDLAESIVEGRGVDWLIARWRSRAGAGAVAREVAVVSRTASMAAANEGSLAVYRDLGPELIPGVQWEATFDRRTCVVCSSRHGRVYRVNEAPALPAHFQCRCTWLPVFADANVQGLSKSLQRYTANGAITRSRVHDRSFERYLRQLPPDGRADFFPSMLKRRVWENGSLKLADLVARDGSIRTDDEVRTLLRSRKLRVP